MRRIAMPKVKPLGKTKKVLTKLEKNQKRATVMETTLKEAINKEKQKQYFDYVELKMIKGHSKEEAEYMAKKQIYEQKEMR